jgi:hypothetical protein
MTSHTNQNSLKKAALVAGLAILGSVLVAPFAELYAFPKLVVPFEAAETARNILAHKSLFIVTIFCYMLTFLCDIVITWALYILLKPTDKNLSLLVAGFRLVYSVIALVALNNLVTAFQLLDTPGYLKVFEQNQLYAQVMIFLRAFKNHWYFGIIFFGIHLVFLGYLVYKSAYIPKALGVVLIITGLGYLLTTLRPFLYPNVRVDFAKYTFYGELLFMLWLLFKGSRMKDPNTSILPTLKAQSETS